VGGLDHFRAGRSFDYQAGEILGSGKPHTFREFLSPNADRVPVLALTHYPI
jgi:hypothetical protein